MTSSPDPQSTASLCDRSCGLRGRGVLAVGIGVLFACLGLSRAGPPSYAPGRAIALGTLALYGVPAVFMVVCGAVGHDRCCFRLRGSVLLSGYPLRRWPSWSVVSAG
jgi:hypothetical protein